MKLKVSNKFRTTFVLIPCVIPNIKNELSSCTGQMVMDWSVPDRTPDRTEQNRTGHQTGQMGNCRSKGRCTYTLLRKLPVKPTNYVIYKMH